ncbi:MAG: beta-phosphoglucomutase family hydrolase [Bifidobacterium sp.]|jgi:alpha,alpha-trehalose phosphorylase|nr:beta-phosphoglucomutase family hydrolase [Bifidobacterium sp.]
MKAVLFDLDGVLVPTTTLHMQAWNDLFTSFLPHDVPAYTDQDYFTYVDGKPRYDGVASVLENRGIEIAQGSPSDEAGVRTICGLGNLKNDIFERLLAQHGIEPYDDTVDVLRHYTAEGLRLAVVSSSKNAREVLKRAGIIQFFDEIVDGDVRVKNGLRGKPAPDTFLFGAQLLHVDVDEAAVFEDAVSGVAAARAGNFGKVIGVNRGVGQKALLKAGADIVIENLVEMIDGSISAVRRRLKDQDDPLSEDIYPIDPWRFTEKRAPSDASGTLFSVANGTIGIRGAGAGDRSLGNGTFLSGFHENRLITYPEDSYGLARVDQSIQGVPDASDFHMILDGRPVDAHLTASKQEIDFRSGASINTVEYGFGPGRTLTATISRVVCLFEPHLALIRLSVASKGLSGSSLEIEGRLNVQQDAILAVSNDPRKNRAVPTGIERVLRETVEPPLRRARAAKTPTSALAQADIVDVYRCQNSRLMMAVGLRQYVNGQRTNATRWRFFLEEGTGVEIERYGAYHNVAIDPRGVSNGLETATLCPQNPSKLAADCRKTLERYGAADPAFVLRKQRAWLTRFWKHSDIRISAKSSDRLQQALRWELFQLAQATASVPNGISAKGLSGTGYEGHYFWDTEIYILPFLIFSDPKKARKVLEYRYRMLPAARRRAAVLNLAGALFPWRTINGEEASSYFPAGTAQYHINADVAYAVEQYVSATGDFDFLYSQGIDILVETARMWASIGFVDVDKHYHIHRVTGPDEYSALVDDNFYTNAMARFNLRCAYENVTRLQRFDPQLFSEVSERLHMGEGEAQTWRAYADAMELPYDERLGIHAQDDDFLHQERWDFQHYKARPLLLHYHSLDIYKKQVLKQPDVVLALMLLGDEFSANQKAADYEYYDAITTGDSTLSAAVQSIVGAEIGREDRALSYFSESLFADIANAHDNTSDGVHLASAGGVWLSLVEGFAGLRVKDGQITFTPHLPQGWDAVSFNLRIHGDLIKVTVLPDKVTTETLKAASTEPSSRGVKEPARIAVAS